MLLRRLLDRDRALEDPSTPERVRVNLEFHNAIWDAAHNGVLRDMLERLALNGVSSPQTTLDNEDRWRVSLDQHAELIDAIEARDTQLAREVAQKHISDAKALRIKILTDRLSDDTA
jgi:DNA-binding GntR family transcriptional regulator